MISHLEETGIRLASESHEVEPPVLRRTQNHIVIIQSPRRFHESYYRDVGDVGPDNNSLCGCRGAQLRGRCRAPCTPTVPRYILLKTTLDLPCVLLICLAPGSLRGASSLRGLDPPTGNTSPAGMLHCLSKSPATNPEPRRHCHHCCDVLSRQGSCRASCCNEKEKVTVLEMKCGYAVMRS